MVDKIDSVDLDVEWLKFVVSMHCPEFRFHPKDKYMPCSAEFFVNNSELRVLTKDGKNACIYERGSLDCWSLLEFQSSMNRNSFNKVWMHLDPSCRSGMNPTELDEIPVYANVKAIHSKRCKETIEALEINYITIYPYNGEYMVAGLIATGAHDGDIEHITVRCHPTTGELLGVFYNAHRSRDGQWLARDRVPRSCSGRIVAYVALHGHGTYPEPEIVPRHFYLGNDHCSVNGPTWSPRNIVMLPLTISFHDQVVNRLETVGKLNLWEVALCESRGCSLPGLVEPNDADIHTLYRNVDVPNVISSDPCPWHFFDGFWGTVPNARKQSWFYLAEPPVSRTKLQRLFLHFWPETPYIGD